MTELAVVEGGHYHLWRVLGSTSIGKVECECGAQEDLHVVFDQMLRVYQLIDNAYLSCRKP